MQAGRKFFGAQVKGDSEAFSAAGTLSALHFALVLTRNREHASVVTVVYILRRIFQVQMQMGVTGVYPRLGA